MNISTSSFCYFSSLNPPLGGKIKKYAKIKRLKAKSNCIKDSVYIDEGVSGTKKAKRNGLLSMVADYEKGKIEFIVTKSIGRFARNTTDCLELVRRLLDLNIYIYFEKENLNTGSMESELMLSILRGLSESESVSISENNKWSAKDAFKMELL